MIIVDAARCSYCGGCVSICPVDALLAAYQEQAEEVLGRRLARNYRLRQRFPLGARANRQFVRLFVVAAGGK